MIVAGWEGSAREDLDRGFGSALDAREDLRSMRTRSEVDAVARRQRAERVRPRLPRANEKVFAPRAGSQSEQGHDRNQRL